MDAVARTTHCADDLIVSLPHSLGGLHWLTLVQDLIDTGSEEEEEEEEEEGDSNKGDGSGSREDLPAVAEGSETVGGSKGGSEEEVDEVEALCAGGCAAQQLQRMVGCAQQGRLRAAGEARTCWRALTWCPCGTEYGFWWVSGWVSGRLVSRSMPARVFACAQMAA